MIGGRGFSHEGVAVEADGLLNHQPDLSPPSCGTKQGQDSKRPVEERPGGDDPITFVFEDRVYTVSNKAITNKGVLVRMTSGAGNEQTWAMLRFRKKTKNGKPTGDFDVNYIANTCSYANVPDGFVKSQITRGGYFEATLKN